MKERKKYLRKLDYDNIIKIKIDTNKGSSNRYLGEDFYGIKPTTIKIDGSEIALPSNKEYIIDGEHEIEINFGEQTASDMNGMFNGCNSIIFIDFSNFDT